jgi:hypothetical protein
MPLQIVDYSEVPHVLGQVAVVVAPRCRAPPPAPRLASLPHLAQALRQIYGVQITPALQDQRDLGLDVVDPVLLFGQLPLESAWIARLMPHGNGIYKCVAAQPDPITAAVAVLSHKPGPVAVDLRYGGVKYVDIVVRYAEEVGVELQLIVSKPLDVGGEVVFHASTPPYIREKYIKAPGDVSVKRGGVALGEAPLDSRPADGEEPPFHKALERVAEVLGLSIDVLGDLVAQGVVSHSYLMDFVSAWQLGYLAKWDLVRQVPGGWSATPKLIFLYGLYRR